MHYQRLIRHGDPLTKLDMRGEPASVRFAAKVNTDGPIPAHAPTLGRCWLWLGAVNSDGYGSFHVSVSAHAVKVHRWSWERVNGPVPRGLELDHLCRVRCCVNPAHLEAVTRRQNAMRGVSFAVANAAKTHCPQGHPYDDANTYRLPSRPTARYCRTCMRERKRKP